MPRSISEASRELAKRLIRAGELTVRAIALEAGIGVGTVTRMKIDMGLGSLDGRGNAKRKLPQTLTDKAPNMKGGRPPNLDALPKNHAPSAAHLRLAAFDPIIRRTLAPSENEDE